MGAAAAGWAARNFRELSIAQSFTLANVQENSLTRSWSWDVSAGLKLPEIPGLSFFSASTGVHYQVAKATAVAQSLSSAISVTGSVSLIVETLKLNLAAPEFEKCLLVKLNPKLFISKPDGWITSGRSPYVAAMNPRLSSEEKEHYARSGYLICDGQTRREKLHVTENYYVLNQKLPNGQILDNASEVNRPFFVSIRGENDFVSFLSDLSDSQQIPNAFTGEYQRSQMVDDSTTGIFLRGVRNVPGVITAPARRW